MADDDYERRLFLARNEIEDTAAADKINHFYIPSFSHRVIVYKGLLVSAFAGEILSRPFEPGLRDRRLRLSSALQHEHVSEMAARSAVPDARA